ncbi:MAG: hypothetical protein WAW69_16360, partial [Polaromonas sp.]
EEDLSRLIGDAPAHALADVGRRVATGLMQFLASGSSSRSAPSSPAPGSAPAAPGSFAAGNSPVPDAAKAVDSEPGAKPPQAAAVPAAADELHEVKSVGPTATPKAAA